MSDPFAPMMGQIGKLWASVGRMPVVRWATVVQVSPLRVLLDGDLEVLPFTPASLVRDFAEGARVVCVEQHRRVTIIDAPRAGLTRRIGSSSASTGAQTGIATTATEITGTSVAFTLDAPARIVFSGGLVTFSGSVADVVVVDLRDNSATIADRVSPSNSSSVHQDTSMSQQISGEVFLAAGAHRLNLAVRRVVGTGSVTVMKTVLNPAFLIVDRIL